MTVKLLTAQHLEFLSLKGGCTGSSESTLVRLPHYWKSNVQAYLSILPFTGLQIRKGLNDGVVIFQQNLIK